MLELIGNLLPAAVGIAVSPVPVIAVVLMLMSARARVAGPAFVLGWVLGISVATALATLVFSGSGGGDAEEPATWQSVLRLVLGAGLLFLAVRKFREPAGGESLPGWMAAVDTMPVLRTALLAAALAALNPKNLAMVLAAADSAAGTGAPRGDVIGGLVVFVLLASSSVALPVLAHLLAPRAVAGPLERLKEWLVLHNAGVMATLLLVLGVVLVGQGLTGL